MRISEVMTHEVVAVPPAASLKDAARLLAAHGISGLPVVEGRAVLGVISETDIVECETGDLHRLVVDAMSSPAVTVDSDWAVADAAKVMLAKGVNRLPVLERGKLVGIVTRADLVRAFVRSDEEIAMEIRDDVLVRQLWIDPEKVCVAVDDGAVTLSGVVDRHAEISVLAGLVRRVPGVVGVQSELHWHDLG
jgi:CBS domain-containing protein